MDIDTLNYFFRSGLTVFKLRVARPVAAYRNKVNGTPLNTSHAYTHRLLDRRDHRSSNNPQVQHLVRFTNQQTQKITSSQQVKTITIQPLNLFAKLGMPSSLVLVSILMAMVSVDGQTPALSDNLVMLPCNGGITQAYDIPNATFPYLEGKIVVRGSEEAPPPENEILVWCIADTPQLGATMHLWGNSTNNEPQMWRWDATSQLVRSTYSSATENWCIGAPLVPGIPLSVVTCNETNPMQQFVYNALTGAFSSASQPSLCVDAGSAPPNCSDLPFASYTYCNSSAAPSDRAADLVSRLTVVDMAFVLEQTNPGIPRLGSECWWSAAVLRHLPFCVPDACSP